MPSIYINVYRTPYGTEITDSSWTRYGADKLAEMEERRYPDNVRIACKALEYRDGEGLGER